MRQFLIELLRHTPLFEPIKQSVRALRGRRELSAWKAQGRPVPPPHIVKQLALRNHARNYGLSTLVETGTYMGTMVDAMKYHFDHVYSIELSRELFEKARHRFAGDGRITIIQGDSGVELGKLVPQLDKPALFWLDGHYSGGVTAMGEKFSPIYEELEHIFSANQPGHVIIIDDARLFVPGGDYPSLEELLAFIRSRRPTANVVVMDDSIRITPH